MQGQKKYIAVLRASSLRDLIEDFNTLNSTDNEHPILKEDVLTVLHEDDKYFLLYFK